VEKDEAIELLNKSMISVWNSIRDRNTSWVPDLSDSVIDGDLCYANLKKANLCGSDLSKAKMYADGTKSHKEANQSGTKIEGSLFDIATKFPPGVDAAVAGAVYITKKEHKRKDMSHSRIFISYAWANDQVVEAMDAWMRAKGLVTKLDKRDFFAGARIRDEILRVMKDCDVILIFHSKDSAEKPWPEYERELAGDLAMSAKKDGRQPPRTIYIVLDDVGLPNVSEENKIAIIAKGKRFELVCEEIYHNIMQLPRDGSVIDLDKWTDFVF